MFRHKAHIRLISLFVVAFVCLNAGGAACVAYCQTFDVAAEPEHCPLKKIADDCDKEGETNGPSVAVKAGEADCCPMTVSFFAGPIEKQTFSKDQAQISAAVESTISRPVFGLTNLSPAESNYRGPPLLDRRAERIKNRIFRI